MTRPPAFRRASTHHATEWRLGQPGFNSDGLSSWKALRALANLHPADPHILEFIESHSVQLASACDFHSRVRHLAGKQKLSDSDAFLQDLTSRVPRTLSLTEPLSCARSGPRQDQQKHGEAAGATIAERGASRENPAWTLLEFKSPSSTPLLSCPGDTDNAQSIQKVQGRAAVVSS